MTSKNKTMKSLTKTSTIHGLPQLFHSKFRFIKVIWLIMICIALTLSLVLIIHHIIDYLKFDVITNAFAKFDKTPFPTVTICNLNPFTSNYSLDLMNHFLNNFTSSRGNMTNADLSGLKAMFKINARIFPDEKKKQLGLDVSEMILHCKFFGEPCNMTRFAWFYSMNFGNCFQFNSGFDMTGNN